MNAATPELKAAILRMSNQLSKVRIFAATPNPEDPSGDPIEVDDKKSPIPANWAALAQAEVARLRAPLGGQPEIIRTYHQNADLVGECFLVGESTAPDPAIPNDADETWQIYSIRECRAEKNGQNPDTGLPMYTWKIYSSPNDQQGRKLDPERSTVIRLWTRGPEWSMVADSPMTGLLLLCEVLNACTQLQASDAYSKMNAGVLLVANEMGYGDDSQVDDEGDPEATEPDDDSDPLLDAIDAAISEPIEDPLSSSAHTPTIVRGPMETIKTDVFRHLTFDRKSIENLDARIEGVVMRMARGLNVPVESVTGLMRTTFSNAIQLDKDEWEKYGEPRMGGFVEGLAFGFLRPNLLDAACPPEVAQQITVWYDYSALIPDNDPESLAAATALYTANELSGEAYRRALGHTEDDAPKPIERAMRIIAASTAAPPELFAAMIEALDPALKPVALPANGDQTAAGMATMQMQAMLNVLARVAQQPAVAASGGVPPRVRVPSTQTPAAQLATTGRTDIGDRLASIDQALRSRVLTAADMAMGRALDRAGNRLRSATQKNTELRTLIPNGTPGRAVASLLGRAIVASASPADMFDGAWSELEQQFRDWAAVAGSDALDAVNQLSAGLPTALRDQLKLRQADDVDTAWQWMANALQSVAEARLFDPDPALPELGELDVASTVPAGLIRRAMSIAGGRNDLAVNVDGDVTKAGAWVTIGGPTPGGIGTGTLVGEAVQSAGGQVEGYEWDYGDALRLNSFEPHEDLDGVQFVNFDDAQLANSYGFPDVEFFFPGDHGGCGCDFVPIIIDTGA